MEKLKKNPNDIVYVYNFKNFVTVTRKRDGTWYYHYKISTVHKKFEESHDKKLNTRIASDMFDLGEKFGLLIAELLKKCEKSYENKN